MPMSSNVLKSVVKPFDNFLKSFDIFDNRFEDGETLIVKSLMIIEVDSNKNDRLALAFMNSSQQLFYIVY